MKRDQRWILRLGLPTYIRVLTDAVPLLDRMMAYALYWKGEPLLLSSGFVHLFDARSRTDVSGLPKVGATDELHGRAIHWGHCRSWSVLHGGEMPAAVPTVPQLGSSQAYLATAPQRWALAWASAAASRDVDTRLVCVRDSGRTLPMAPELPLALGYGPTDHSWVPDRWRRPLRAGQPEVGSDVVYTGDHERLPARIWWHRVRGRNGLNIYLARLTFIDDDDFSDWPIRRLVDGVPDDVDDVLRRLQGRDPSGIG